MKLWTIRASIKQWLRVLVTPDRLWPVGEEEDLLKRAAKAMKLDPDTAPKESIEKLIGYPISSTIKCGECLVDTETAVSFAEDAVNIKVCRACLEKALALMNETPDRGPEPPDCSDDSCRFTR